MERYFKRYGLFIALAALVAVLLLPTPDGLSLAGQRLLGVFAFAVIVWMSECVSYPISSIFIVTLIALLVGMAPDPAHPNVLMGTGKALGMALSGFSSNALALVGCALFIAVAMTKTGLERRIALFVLSKIGTKTNHVIAGVIAVGFVMSFLIPSTTARVSCLVPIVMGIILAFGVDKKSRFAQALILAVTLGDLIWNVGIKTAAAQNMIAVGIIANETGVTIDWLTWFSATIPFMVVMPVVLYFLLLLLMPPEFKDIENGRNVIAEARAALGPISRNEKKLLCIMIVLLGFWSTENVLHHFDTSTTTLVAAGIMLLPRVGVMDWKEVQTKLAWGTLMLFGAGIGLGSVLLKLHVADWMANYVVAAFGLTSLSAFAIIAVLGAFLIVLHLGFASSTAMAATMIPIILSVLQSTGNRDLNIVGMTLILQFLVSFDVILPANGPQNMVAYSTDTFEVADFIKVGLPMTIIGYALILAMALFYWPLLGLL